MGMNKMKTLLTPSPSLEDFAVPTTKEALAQGMMVCLPNILDDIYFLLDSGMSPTDVLIDLSYEIAEEHDISATQAQDVILFTCKQLKCEDLLPC